MPEIARTARSVLLVLPIVLLGGCVKRTIMVTSDPEGALVWLNEREVGRTPVEVEFLYYGTYDVRLVKDGYEPLLTKGEAEILGQAANKQRDLLLTWAGQRVEALRQSGHIDGGVLA